MSTIAEKSRAQADRTPQPTIILKDIMGLPKSQGRKPTATLFQ
jgi:hypothetical protein